MHLSTNHPASVTSFFDGVSFTIDSNKTWSYLCPTWEALTGFSIEETVGRPIDSNSFFADFPIWQELVNDLLTGKQQRASHELAITTAAGETRYVELLLAAQARDKGSNQSSNDNDTNDSNDAGNREIVGVMRNITERKQVEEALVRSEQRTQQIVNNMPCMVACYSPTLLITFANDAYAAYVGKTVDEVIGASLIDLLHPSVHNITRQHLTALSKHNPTYVFEQWTTRFDGEQRFQRWTDHVFFDEHGRISEYQTVGIDLTDNKRIEDELRLSESKFRALVENIMDVILTVDLEGKFTYFSPSWETVTGYPVEAFLGISAMTIVHPADINIVQERMATLLAGKPLTESVFYRIEHADGQWHWHAGRSAPIIDDEGNITGAVAVVRDITTVREHQLLLQASLDQLEQTLKDKALLMKEIHHRVKNNLQIVASLLSIQSRQLQDTHAKDALAASRDRVIAMAKIHHMMYESDNSNEVFFDDYLYSLLERIQQAYGGSNTTFNIDGDRFALPISQAVPLGLIVNELLTNAVKYAFPAPQEDDQVTIRLVSEQDNITMIVEDNGIGLTADVDPLMSDSLGMTIVQSLTTQLNGDVTFTNRTDGSGLWVAVTIPIYDGNDWL